MPYGSCESCGQGFQGRAGSRFCSLKCFGAAKTVHQSMPCPVCEKEFLPKSKGAGVGTTHCSAKCAGVAKSQRIRGTAPAVCVVCGVEYPPKDFRSKTCSRKCGARMRPDAIPEVQCESCGTGFRRRGARFCSMACRSASRMSECQKCGEEYRHHYPEQKFCSRTCAGIPPTKAHKHGRKGYDRYGCRCGLCCLTKSNYLRERYRSDLQQSREKARRSSAEYRERRGGPDDRTRQQDRERYRRNKDEHCRLVRARLDRLRAQIPVTRSGVPWTPEEDQIVLRDDITAVEMAYLTGRGLAAIRSRRSSLQNPEAARAAARRSRQRNHAKRMEYQRQWRARARDQSPSVSTL